MDGRGPRINESNGGSPSTKYLYHNDEVEIEFTWQANSDKPNWWYGLRCDINRPCDDTLDMLRRIRKAYGQSFHFHTDPREGRELGGESEARRHQLPSRSVHPPVLCGD